MISISSTRKKKKNTWCKQNSGADILDQRESSPCGIYRDHLYALSNKGDSQVVHLWLAWWKTPSKELGHVHLQLGLMSPNKLMEKWSVHFPQMKQHRKLITMHDNNAGDGPNFCAVSGKFKLLMHGNSDAHANKSNKKELFCTERVPTGWSDPAIESMHAHTGKGNPVLSGFTLTITVNDASWANWANHSNEIIDSIWWVHKFGHSLITISHAYRIIHNLYHA